MLCSGNFCVVAHDKALAEPSSCQVNLWLCNSFNTWISTMDNPGWHAYRRAQKVSFICTPSDLPSQSHRRTKRTDAPVLFMAPWRTSPLCMRASSVASASNIHLLRVLLLFLRRTFHTPRTISMHSCPSHHPSSPYPPPSSTI